MDKAKHESQNFQIDSGAHVEALALKLLMMILVFLIQLLNKISNWLQTRIDQHQYHNRHELKRDFLKKFVADSGGQVDQVLEGLFLCPFRFNRPNKKQLEQLKWTLGSHVNNRARIE